MTPVSDRDRYLAMLSNGPLLTADAIVVLVGEDAEPRLAVARELMQQGAAPLCVLSGGKHDGVRWLGADHCAGLLMGAGIGPSRIRAEMTSQHTRDQATIVTQMAIDAAWKRILLVASSYHIYRAHLTFLHALMDAEADRQIHVLVAPASQSPWHAAPEGMADSRSELFASELEKIDVYGATGHVASYADGLAYLKHWEGK